MILVGKRPLWYHLAKAQYDTSCQMTSTYCLPFRIPLKFHRLNLALGTWVFLSEPVFCRMLVYFHGFSVPNPVPFTSSIAYPLPFWLPADHFSDYFLNYRAISRPLIRYCSWPGYCSVSRSVVWPQQCPCSWLSWLQSSNEPRRFPATRWIRIQYSGSTVLNRTNKWRYPS